MSNTRELVDSIISGDTVAMETAFETIMSQKVSDRVETFKQEVSQSMFKESEEKSEDVVDVQITELVSGSTLKGKDVEINLPGHKHHGKIGTVHGGASNNSVQTHLVKFKDGSSSSFSHKAVKRTS